MAQKVNIILEDDLDGGDADETVEFGVDGVSYEIDLSSANAAALREAFATYVANGRKVGGRRRTGTARRSSTPADGPGSAAEIRQWAREKGMDVPARGRVSAEVREAFAAAH